ncbi:MAG: MFS transporter, partial [Phenylobacterium sp.]|nr:MFS transporter [Phenylobacterium sp.]
FDPVGKTAFRSSCDIAKSALASAGVSYDTREAVPGSVATVDIGGTQVAAFEGAGMATRAFGAEQTAWRKSLGAALHAKGYPQKADPALVDEPKVVAVLFVLILLVTMVYGPIAAALVEMFPARIRYTSMSLPYHIGNGWFGCFLPTTAFAMVAATGNIYYGLWYPIVIAAVTVVVGVFFVKEMRGANIDA